ncbi:peroxiredoxin-like family protein [Zobellia nedashkovskayae]|uniref:peroxiredoxin-like family protein n=1 Tax=Zobellia nedashkovskayae TaxID=2779510 RepID=UPI00188D06F8|nr:peroxiredoxin-like family protein [Zobellia nedashkovskayae]
MSELQDFQKLVISNASHLQGLSVGDKAPDFTLPNALGKDITLSEMLKSGIVVIKFYRGGWCPICNLDLREVQSKLPEIKSLGASFLAISPQSPDSALTAKEKNNLDFEVLSDADQKVIKAYGLQFDPGEDYHARRDLTLLNGDGSKTLPIPATFIINTNQTIEEAHVEANYTERMGVDEILRILKVITHKV